MISIRCFWSYGKILFLAEIIACHRSALMCNCIARAIFNRASWKSSLKIYLLLHFLSNHPKTFRICSRDHLEEMSQTEFWVRPLNIFYSILKILELGFLWFFDVQDFQNQIKMFKGLSQNSVWLISSKCSLEHILKVSGWLLEKCRCRLIFRLDFQDPQLKIARAIELHIKALTFDRQ